MVDVLDLAGMLTMSISHPNSVGHYKIMVININLVKDHDCSEYDVLT